MPDIKTKAITQIKTKAENPSFSSTDVILNKTPLVPQEQEPLPCLKFREPPPVRTKEDIFNGDTEEAIQKFKPQNKSNKQPSLLPVKRNRSWLALHWKPRPPLIPRRRTRLNRVLTHFPLNLRL